MTNADCIRRMNDEQLYDFLSEWECGDIDYSITFCDLCKQGGNELNLDCDGCRKHWLQRDAVEYGGLMYWKKNTTFDATADRKTENCSEKPNNCEHITEDDVTCAKCPACDDCLDNPLNKVKGSERLVKGSEQTDCQTCKWWSSYGYCVHRECKGYEPRTERSE